MEVLTEKTITLTRADLGQAGANGGLRVAFPEPVHVVTIVLEPGALHEPETKR